MPKGNPNPSPETRFGAENGNPINTGGKTSEQRRLEYEAALIAAKLRHKALSDMLEKVEGGADVMDYIDANGLKLFKDSEDRAHGTPKQSTELSGPDGGAIPVTEVAYKVVYPTREKD